MRYQIILRLIFALQTLILKAVNNQKTIWKQHFLPIEKPIYFIFKTEYSLNNSHFRKTVFCQLQDNPNKNHFQKQVSHHHTSLQFLYYYNSRNHKLMKKISVGQDLQQFHEKCVCQICSCQKHRCPHSKLHIPHTEITSYQNQFVKHPINTWKKPPPQKAPEYRPYDYINSAYREHYHGPKPQMREKIVPRVKDQKRDIPFDGTSEYATKFGPKRIDKEKVWIKDIKYTPDNQPFNSSTTYNSFFNKKTPHPQQINQNTPVKFPQGYKFNPSTTYNNDFNEKKLNPNKSFKPIQTIPQKGDHDLNTIYRQDYKEKPQPQICPILKMPTVPHNINHPSQHLVYNKFKGTWTQK